MMIIEFSSHAKFDLNKVERKTQLLDLGSASFTDIKTELEDLHSQGDAHDNSCVEIEAGLEEIHSQIDKL